MVFRMIQIKDSLLPVGKVWFLDFLGIPTPSKVCQMVPKVLKGVNSPSLRALGLNWHPFEGAGLYIILGGGFKYFLSSPLSLEKIPTLTSIFSNGLKPPTSIYVPSTYIPFLKLIDRLWKMVVGKVYFPYGFWPIFSSVLWWLRNLSFRFSPFWKFTLFNQRHQLRIYDSFKLTAKAPATWWQRERGPASFWGKTA